MIQLARRIFTVLIIGLGIIISNSDLFAASSQYSIGAGLHYFSGKDGEALSPDTGTVLKFAAGEGRGEVFRYWTSLSLLLGNDKATFTASSSASELDYQLKGGEFQLGMKIVPLANNIKIPIQPYIGVNIVIQNNQFAFDESATVAATFPFSDSQMFYGYSITVGTDILMSKRWGWFLEVEQGVVSGTLGGSTFATGGNRILFGITFF